MSYQHSILVFLLSHVWQKLRYITGFFPASGLLRHAEECRKGGASLTFHLNGQDLTGAEAKITQRLIDEHLHADLLPKAVFHTQTDIAGLLEVR